MCWLTTALSAETSGTRCLSPGTPSAEHTCRSHLQQPISNKHGRSRNSGSQRSAPSQDLLILGGAEGRKKLTTTDCSSRNTPSARTDSGGQDQSWVRPAPTQLLDVDRARNPLVGGGGGGSPWL